MPTLTNLPRALELAESGVPVFPCRQDKTPYTANGFKAATTDRKTIEQWWGRWPEALVGMPTGKVSGVVVLDSDRREGYDGEDALYQLEHKYGSLPNAPTVLTPGGGQHRYFRYPPGHLIRNSAGKLGRGLDVRGEGGYVIAAGTVLADGRRYELEASSPPAPPEMPAWLLRAIGIAPVPQQAHSPANGRPVAEGGRNAYLASVAGRLVHSGMNAEQVQVMVLAENDRVCVPPLPRAEVDRTVMRSATRWIRAGEAPAGDLPDPPSVDEYLALDIPKQRQLLGPISTQQMVLVHAPTGTGKTLWGLALSYALSRGRDLHGWKSSGELASVLYVDGEMSGGMMQERLQGLTAPDLYLANIQHWALTNGYPPINLADEGSQCIIEGWIERLGTTVLALDNFISLADVAGESLSSDAFWSPVKAWMMRLRGKGLTVILIDHSNESTGQVHGTRSRTWQMDLNISLKPIEADEQRSGLVGRTSKRVLLQFQKARAHDGGADYDARELTLGHPGEDWAWRPASAGVMERVAEMVEAGMPYDQIVTETGISKTALYRAYPKRRKK